MKVFLDDVRPTPPGWVGARWPEEVIDLLKTGQVTALSLDHDLGGDDERRNGYAVLVWLEEQVAISGFTPPAEITVHSSNASARLKMLAAIEAIRTIATRAIHEAIAEAVNTERAGAVVDPDIVADVLKYWRQHASKADPK